jgi:hypothetical protein
LYFYFLSERPDFSTPSHAWRAILAQFLQKYKDHADTVDALSILHDNNTSGQLHATDDEVYQSLLLLLAQANRVTLLIDGIDECIDSDDFLSGLHDVCRKTSTKAVLLGRAGIRIPQSFIDFTLFNLNQTHNRDDITRYLRPEIESLQTDTLISPELPPEKIISTLVDRSQGMFLWASLMVRYLNCEALSPNERREAIFHLHVVQGIEGLYHRILMTLQNTYTKQLERVIKIFSLITVARWPLKVSELQFALAVRPGIPTDEGDLIRRFRASLPIMCRSLVEISDQDSVTFVHSSFRDFLTNVDGPLSGTPFLVNSAVAHINVSATCLSCLLYDIPCGPLSQSGKRADALFVAEVLCPWLEYSLNWTYHATTGLQLLALINGEQDGEATSELIRLLSTFLEQRLRITTWFEAAWTFTSNPSLTPLVELFSCSENSCIQGEMGKHPRMVANLKACAADLCRLHREWGHLLSLKPNAIWRSSITAFTKSEYLYETSNTIVSSLAPPEVLGHSLSSENQVAQSAILIQSQVSDSGLTLGIIFVLPSQ